MNGSTIGRVAANVAIAMTLGALLLLTLGVPLKILYDGLTGMDSTVDQIPPIGRILIGGFLTVVVSSFWLWAFLGAEEEADNDLVAALWDVRRAFKSLPNASEPTDLKFWLNLADQQIIEAREHLEAGRPDKVLAEIADLFSVGFQALHAQGVDPEHFIVKRIRERIIPRVQELHDRDLAGYGYKPKSTPEGSR